MVLRCDQCHGAAERGGVRCRACSGVGAAVAWGDLMLTWSLPVDARAVRGRVIQRTVRAIIAVVAFVGAIALFVAAFLVSQEKIIAADGIRDAGNLLGNPLLGIGALLVVLAIAQVVRERERTAAQAPRLPTDPDASFAQPPSLAGIAPSARVDIARALAPDARVAVERAAVIAERFRHATVDTVHLFAAALGTSAGAVVVGRLGVDSTALKERIERALAKQPTFAQVVTLAPGSTAAIARAYADVARSRQPAVTPADLLAALSAGEDVVRDILDDLGVTHAQVVNVAVWARVRRAIVERHRRYRAAGALRSKHGMNRTMTAIATPILDAFGDDLTAFAARGQLGPYVGRDRELRELLRVFEGGRPGVVLVGESGVGKDAIIESLAERMAGEDVPATLADTRLVRLDVARLTSGAAPAAAQERLLGALAEAARSRNILLAVDSVEQLVAAAAGEGAAAVDLGDVLASASERAGLRIIAATTPEAYRAAVERTPLGNILERIPVEEPTGDDAIQIVEARAILVEARQRVFFSYAAIEACVRLSDRYLHDRVLPAKAVALLDEAAALVRSERGEGQVVTREDVARLVEEKTGIPAGDIQTDEAQKLLHLEEELHRRIVGQDEAVRAVAAALRRARVDLRSGKRPIATFLFLGPTGVGKTELAKTVAAAYFGAEGAMVRLDMSEYQDATAIARLLGAPPGSGAEAAGGQLTEAVRRNPFSLILLDEIEKAHPDILNLFLQVFEDGRLTDSMGRTVDFSETITIATSNAGAPYVQGAIAAGTSAEEVRRTLLERELRGVFRPEFLNRFDGIIVFTPLTREDIRAVASRMLAKVGEQLAAKGIRFRVTDAAVLELADAGFDPQFGARPLRRVIQERVQDALATFLLSNTLGRRDTAVLDAGGALTIEQAEEL